MLLSVLLKYEVVDLRWNRVGSRGGMELAMTIKEVYRVRVRCSGGGKGEYLCEQDSGCGL